jgi:hypothetical protein
VPPRLTGTVTFKAIFFAAFRFRAPSPASVKLIFMLAGRKEK